MVKAFVSVFLFVLLSACGAEQRSELFPYEFQLDDLPNGLRLVTVPTDYPDIVALHVLVNTGSRNEVEPGKSGFAHFFEHMMFRGSENYSSEDQARIFKAVGADRNAYTTDDYTNYHTTFAKEDLETVLELEADRFQRLSYSLEDFRTESQAVLGEYNKNSSDPLTKIFEVVRDTTYQSHPYKHTTMGFLRDIEQMPEQFDYSKEFFQRWYKPEYVTLVVVGDVQREEVLRLTEKHFGGWERGEYTVEIPQESPQQGPLTCHVEWPTPTQPWVVVSFRGPAFSPIDGEMPALDVLGSIGFSESSEIFKKLFVEERKVDTLFSYFIDHKDPYLLMVIARVKDPNDIGYVRDQIISTCERLKNTLVSEERLTEVKSNLKYTFASGLDSSAAIAEHLAGYVASTRTPATINTLFETYDGVTAEGVREMARKDLVTTGRTVCTLTHGDAPDLGEVTVSEVDVEPKERNIGSAPALPDSLDVDADAPNPELAVLMPSNSPLVSFRIVFSSGSATDPNGKEGLAYVTSQMIADAATRERSYDDIIAAFFPMAAGVGVSVDKQMTVFSGTAHRDNLAPFYALAREVLTRPAFDQADLDRIKSNTVSYIDDGLRRADDEETGKEVLYQEIYADHPYGHLNVGSISGVESITLDDVKGLYASEYREPFLGLSGGYPKGFPARVAADLADSFGPAADVAEPDKFQVGISSISSNRLTIVQKDTRATGIHLGFPIDITRADPDWIALWMVRSYFGQHRSENSYLYQRLREIRGLNYGDYAYIEYFPNGGGQFHPDPNLGRTSQIFQIWIRPVPPDNGPFTFKAMNYELRKLVEQGMSEEDFEATRTFLSKFVNILVASQDRQLGYAIDSRFYGTLEFAKYVKDGLAGLSLDDVNRVLWRHLRSDRLQFVVITADAEGFRDAILSEDPTPITYTSPPPDEILAEDKIIERLKVELGDVRIVPIDDVFSGRRH